MHTDFESLQFTEKLCLPIDEAAACLQIVEERFCSEEVLALGGNVDAVGGFLLLIARSDTATAAAAEFTRSCDESPAFFSLGEQLLLSFYVTVSPLTAADRGVHCTLHRIVR